MATKILYFKDAVPSGATVHRSLQDGGSAPATATTGTGWIAGSRAVGDSCVMNGGVEVSRTSGQWGATLQPDTTAPSSVGQAWRTENTLTGTFASGNWQFGFGVRSVTAAYVGRLKLAVRLWRGTNADGTGATQITSARQASAATGSSLTTSATTDVDITAFNPGAFTLTTEYLFVTVGIEITTLGAGNTTDVNFTVGTGRQVTTPDFSTGDSVAEGTVGTAADAPSTAATFVASCAEGSVGTAVDTPTGTTPNVYSDSVAEGSATAADTITCNVTMTANAAEPTPIRYDNFNHTDSPLHGSTPDDGGSTWVRLGTTTTYSCSGGIVTAAPVSGVVPIYLETGVTAGSVQCRFPTALYGYGVYLITRLTDANNFIYLKLASGAGASGIWMVAFGVHYQAVSFTVSLANNDVLKLTDDGNAITAYQNGVELGTTVINFNNSATKRGFYFTSSANFFSNFACGPAASNAVTDSQQITTASTNEGWRNTLLITESLNGWTASFLNFTADATTDPIGGTTADKLTPISAATSHLISQPINSSLSGFGSPEPSRDYYVSVYAKAAGYNWISFETVNLPGASDWRFFNILTGAIGSSGSVPGTIESVGNGWYRCSIVQNSATGSNVNAGVVRVFVATADGNTIFAGDTTSGVYLWGAQREIDQLTSYEAVVIRPVRDVPVTANVFSDGVAEGGATAADALSATGPVTASVAEGGATAADTSTVDVNRALVSWLEILLPVGTVGVFTGTVAEGSATAVAISSTQATFVAVVAEGTASATDTPNANTTFAVAIVEGSTTSVDTSTASISQPTAVVEGTATAVDIPSAKATFASVVAESSVTASDTVTAQFALTAAIVEGTATATDTLVADGALISASVVEGTATAIDTLSVVVTYVGAVAEGTATATDTPSTVAALLATIVEGTATAADIPNAGITKPASVVEGTPTAIDTPSAQATFSASAVEGTPTATDTSLAGTSYVVRSVPEGTATAADTCSTTAVVVVSCAEGTATATDTPSATSILRVSVAETSTINDTVTADLNISLSASVAEGVATAIDTSNTTAVYAEVMAEGSATAIAIFSTTAVLSTSVVEGTATATDTSNALKTMVASVAEGTATAIDAPLITAAVMGAAVAEVSTAIDTPDWAGGTVTVSVTEGTPTSSDSVSVITTFQSSVVEISSGSDTPSAKGIFAATVAEGGATAVDTPDTIVISGSISAIFENGAALDTPSVRINTTAAIVEIGSAQDSPTAGVSYKVVSVAEGTPTTIAVQDCLRFTSANITEGSPTALDNSNAQKLTSDALVVEGGSTANAVPSVGSAVFQGFVAEGADTALDTQAVQAIWNAAVAETSTLVDRCAVVIPDRGVERTPYYDVVTKVYIFDAPKIYIPIFTPVEESELEFEKPLIREPVYE